MYGRGTQTPGFGFGPPVTPPIVKNLLIANGIIFVLQMVYPGLVGMAAIRPAFVCSIKPQSIFGELSSKTALTELCSQMILPSDATIRHSNSCFLYRTGASKNVSAQRSSGCT